MFTDFLVNWYEWKGQWLSMTRWINNFQLENLWKEDSKIQDEGSWKYLQTNEFITNQLECEVVKWYDIEGRLSSHFKRNSRQWDVVRLKTRKKNLTLYGIKKVSEKAQKVIQLIPINQHKTKEFDVKKVQKFKFYVKRRFCFSPFTERFELIESSTAANDEWWTINV